jgi:hypothetical protein
MGCASPHPFHWDDLKDRPRDRVLKQPGVETASKGVGYVVDFLNARYWVDIDGRKISELEPDPRRALSEEFQILLIRYLVAENGAPIAGVDVSEKDLPGGVTFFQGPHALNLAPIAKSFGSDPDAFETRGKQFGATNAAFGDKAMKFFPFPDIPVTYILWRADDEFPASVSVLFDKSITRWFNLDMIFTVVWVLTDRIVEGLGKPE